MKKTNQLILWLFLPLFIFLFSSCKNSNAAGKVIIGTLRVLDILDRADVIDYHLFAIDQKGYRKIQWLSQYQGDGLNVSYKQFQLLFLPVYNYDIQVSGQINGVKQIGLSIDNEFENRDLVKELLSGWSLWSGKIVGIIALILIGIGIFVDIFVIEQT